MQPQVSRPGRDGVPRLAPGCDPRRLSLSPQEGYLLSRIDGRTPWDLLREIGGLPPDEVDRCLSRWLEQGVVQVGEGDATAGSGAAPDPPQASAAPARAAELRPEVDPDLEISVELQQRILGFEARLERPYHEILGVPRDAPVRDVKKAYFELSKVFHPDRYFRRRTGPFGERLERIFKKVLEAYEMLSDPSVRAEVERSLRGTPPGAGTTLARRALFGPRARELARRRARSKSFFEAGMSAFARERWLEAAGNVRLAIAFDPLNESMRERFIEVQRRAYEERAAQLLKEAGAAFDLRHFEEALGLYEEALHFRPHDTMANHRAAILSWKIGGDLRKAKEYATTACEVEPENGSHHRVLGQVYKEAGLRANARRELKTALRLDGSDAEARAELKSLRRVLGALGTGRRSG